MSNNNTKDGYSRDFLNFALKPFSHIRLSDASMAGPQKACCAEVCCKLTMKNARKANIFSEFEIIAVPNLFGCMSICQQ